MGGTGLEPVTPSLSSGFSDGDDLSRSPTFPAQMTFEDIAQWPSTTTPRDVCASLVRRLRARTDRSQRRTHEARRACVKGRLIDRRSSDHATRSIQASSTLAHATLVGPQLLRFQPWLVHTRTPPDRPARRVTFAEPSFVAAKQTANTSLPRSAVLTTEAASTQRGQRLISARPRRFRNCCVCSERATPMCALPAQRHSAS
jgi:hypothetical protein